MSYPAKKAYREESVADLYDKDRFTGCKGKLTHRREMAVMMKALGRAGISAPARILDIPCGTGRLSRYLALRGFRMLGLDISAQMISRGRIGAEQIDRQNIIEFIVGDGDALPFHDGEFDAVVSLRLFGHTPPATRKEILGELRRVGQKYLILAYYNKVSLQYYLRKKIRDRTGQEWNPVTIKGIRNELTSVGLKLIKTIYLARWFSETVIVICERIGT